MLYKTFFTFLFQGDKQPTTYEWMFQGRQGLPAKAYRLYINISSIFYSK